MTAQDFLESVTDEKPRRERYDLCFIYVFYCIEPHVVLPVTSSMRAKCALIALDCYRKPHYQNSASGAYQHRLDSTVFTCWARCSVLWQLIVHGDI